MGIVNANTNLISNMLNIPCLPDLDQRPLTGDTLATLRSRGLTINIDCVNWPDQYPAQPRCVVHAAHTGKSLLLDYEVEGQSLRTTHLTDGSKVCEDSCVEFFVEPTGRLPYFNLEFNAIGTMHGAYRSERTASTRLTPSQMSTVKRYPSLPRQPFDSSNTKSPQSASDSHTLSCQQFDSPENYHWNLAIDIPFSLLDIDYQGQPIAMRGNFYSCGDLTATPHYLSHSPIHTPTPDFHRPDTFTPIILL